MNGVAVADALMELDRVTATIAKREGVTIALPNGPAYSSELIIIRQRLADAFGEA